MRPLLIIIAALALAGTATAALGPPHGGHDCGPNSTHRCPPPAAVCGNANAVNYKPCGTEVVPDVDSSPVCRILDAREPVVMVPDAEILAPATLTEGTVSGPGLRSLADGWLPAAYIDGAFVCAPVIGATTWTDDSLSVYDAPNTAYANPVG